MNDSQLDTPYRPEGWTVRQLVHHLADSHMNSYVRFRWALTEPDPTIKAYDEKGWALLPDARSAPVDVSLRLLAALDERWTDLLRALTSDDWNRTFQHPQSGKQSLGRAAGVYAWHGRHHVAHITGLRRRMSW